MDCSLPGSSVHGIFQARVLEWDAIAFSHLLHIPLPDYFSSKPVSETKSYYSHFADKQLAQRGEATYPKPHSGKQLSTIKPRVQRLPQIPLRPQRPAGSTHSSTRGLRPPEQLVRPAGFPSSAQSYLTFCDPMEPTRLLCPWDFPGKNTGASCHFLLQAIFLTQESNLCLLCLLNCRADSLPLASLPATRTAPPSEPRRDAMASMC